MKNKYPDWLVELSKQMNSQPSRSTSHPFWQVRCKKYLVTEEGYSESHWELIHEDDEGCPTYSSKANEDNKALSEDFYERNKEWCDQWMEDNTEETFVGEDDGFYDFFDFEEHKYLCEEWPEGYRVIHFQEVEEIVWTGLTEDAANQFINRKRHDYPTLYTYVESAYWSPQFCQLMDWVKSITE